MKENFDVHEIRRDYRLVAFDLDGTLVEGLEFSWQHIHDYLKIDPKKRDDAKRRFFSGQISYAQWAINDVQLWKEAGADKKKLLDAISNIHLMPGAIETIDELKSHGLKVGVISGSLDFFIEKLFPKDYFDFMYINKMVFKDGKIEKIIPTEFDFAHKKDALIKESRMRIIPLSRCVFVGDHDNDVEVAKIAGLSISFNSKSEALDKECMVVIKEDIRKILLYIL